MIEKLLNEIKKLGANVYSVTQIRDENERTVEIQPANPCNNIYSVAKVYVITALGMLYDRGLLSVDEKITDIFAKYLPKSCDDRWYDCTVENVILHRAGFENAYLDNDLYDVHTFSSTDFMKLIFSYRLRFAPGEGYAYSDGAYYLLARIVYEKTGEKIDDFLMRELFTPLKCREAAWSKCPLGHPMGATGLYLRSCDMARLGTVYLYGGMYKGIRILSQDWTSAVLERGYELGRLGKATYGKGGMNGQMLIIDTERDMSVAWEGYETSEKTKDLVALFA